MESEEKLAFTPSYSWQNPIHACTRWTKYTKNRLAASKLHKNEQNVAAIDQHHQRTAVIVQRFFVIYWTRRR